MKDRLLYKAKNKKNKWVFGNVIESPTATFIKDRNDFGAELELVKDETLLGFTGYNLMSTTYETDYLIEYLSTPLYEGDIFAVNHQDYQNEHFMVIYDDKMCQFKLLSSITRIQYGMDLLNLIKGKKVLHEGNKIDNPELLVNFK